MIAIYKNNFSNLIILSDKISHRNKLLSKSKINNRKPLHKSSLIIRFQINIITVYFLKRNSWWKTR